MSNSKLRDIANELSSEFVEREDIINGIILGAISGNHCIILGPPGTAKSAVITEFANRITGANQFIYLLTKFTTPEEVFGPVSLVALENDRFERITTGKLPEANFSFLDETFKANSAILNSLLTIMNERRFDNGTSKVNVPLISLVGASNETPQDESLVALYDRFMLRYVTHYIASEQNLEAMLTGMIGGSAKKTTMDLSELLKAQSAVNAIVLDRAIVDKVLELKRECAREGFSASDRRWKQSMGILRAAAYLDGRKDIVEDDLLVYSNILWDNPNDKRRVTSVVNRIINPEFAKLQEINDAVDEILASLVKSGGGETAAIEAIAKLKTHKDAIGKIKAGAKGETLKKEIDQKYRTALAKTMGF